MNSRKNLFEQIVNHNVFETRLLGIRYPKAIGIITSFMSPQPAGQPPAKLPETFPVLRINLERIPLHNTRNKYEVPAKRPVVLYAHGFIISDIEDKSDTALNRDVYGAKQKFGYIDAIDISSICQKTQVGIHVRADAVEKEA